MKGLSRIPAILKGATKEYKRNLINSLYYFGPTVVAMLGALFTMPIYSKHLAASDFGLIAYFGSVSHLFMPIASFGIASYYMYSYFKLDEDSRQNLFSSLFSLLSAVNLILIPVGTLVVIIVFKAFAISFEPLPYIVITLVNLLFDAYYGLTLVDLRIKKKGLLFFALSGSSTLLSLFLGVIFVTEFRYGAAGKMLGPVVAKAIVFLVLVLATWRGKGTQRLLKPRFSGLEIKSLFKFVLPIILASYAYFPLQNIDKLYLERLRNPSEFGLYAIGITFFGILNTLTLAIFQAFEPDLYRFYAEKRKSKFVNVFIVFEATIIAMVGVFILLSRTIVQVFTSGRFLGAVVYANINVFSIIFMRAGGFIEMLFVAKAKTKMLLYKNIILGVFSLVVYKLLIDAYAFKGGNYARIITAIMYPLICLGLLRLSRPKKGVIPAALENSENNTDTSELNPLAGDPIEID